MSNQPHAIIMGGGIGGMASAFAFTRIGWRVSIYEQAPELREVGAGLALWANAIRALERLGVAVARSWLYRITTNTAYDYLRRRHCGASTPLTNEHEASLYEPALETHFDDTEPVWAGLNHLSDQYRVPQLLQIWAGYNLNEIAAALGCKVSTIKTRVRWTGLRFR